MSNYKKLFPSVIGQKKARKRLSFYHKGYSATNISPHVMFIAPKGCGKTHLAKAYKDLLFQKDDKGTVKRFIELNCATVKNIKQLCDTVFIRYMQEEYTVLFDECHMMKDDVTAALLTICNPNPDNANTLVTDEHRLNFDFSRQTFMFATTEAHKVFHALMDRCERVDLEEYTHEEMGRIVALNLKGVKFDDGLLARIASTLRSNARKAQQMAGHITNYLSFMRKKDFTYIDWELLSDELSIYPLGVNQNELNVLRKLEGKTNASLTYLSAATNMSKCSLQKDIELYLQKHDLMEISTAGRNITPRGKEFLKMMDTESEEIKMAA